MQAVSSNQGKIEQTEKPLLVNASGAFSNLQIIQYKNRFLYSKYNPLKTILSVIQEAAFLENSIIVICAPCLWYGLGELIQKLPANCKIIAVQDDLELFSISKQFLPRQFEPYVKLFNTVDLKELDSYVRELVQKGQYKRSVRIDFSAGTQLNHALYDSISTGIQEITNSFWLNRITLVKMGRLFSKNIFQNLSQLPNGIPLSRLYNSVNKPIVVCGAGESLDSTPKYILEKCFVISVDAALISLLERNIHVDAVVSLESQYVIQKAYIGTQQYLGDIMVFADIASRPSVPRSIDNKTVWFASEYTQASFLSNLKKYHIVDDFIQPLGSVGLAATLIALRIRCSDNIPVFITGLDFSYSLGLTHAKGTPAHITRQFLNNKLFSIENYDAAFAPGTFFIDGKNSKPMISSKAMKAYADVFTGTFCNFQSLYDIGKTGIPLGLKALDNDSALQLIESLQEQKQNIENLLDKNESIKENVDEFIGNERKALQELKDLLRLGENSPYRNKDISMETQLINLLNGREYLYLHFPDGYKLSTEISFLKRIRAEIDFFLKQLRY